MGKLDVSVLDKYITSDKDELNKILNDKLKGFNKKIVVLDDDPTGVQTVHGINVYTDWSKESIKSGFEENNHMFFILTNSRSFSKEKTIEVHKEITDRVIEVSKETGKEFLMFSRSDSTLRGHYPTETEVIAKTIEEAQGKKIDGEILIPFFVEGGRYTIDDVHYVKEGDYLVEAADTEFAKDKTFGYTKSNLCEYIEEKTSGEFKASDVVSITLDEIMNKNIESIASKLESVNNFGKVIVNATSYRDLMVFSIALLDAVAKGKNFVFRTAAGITKVIGGVPDKPLLQKSELIEAGNTNGGIIIIGSHMKKTTAQFEQLQTLEGGEFIEFNSHAVLQEGEIEKEAIRVSEKANEAIKSKKFVVVYTKRERIDANTGNKEDDLKMSTKISDSLTSVITNLKDKPGFIIAKGGITSSDVGVVALAVKKALVLGQAAAGIPVWQTGAESKFPNMPYIIFPGNVGAEDTLKNVVETLIK